MGILHLLPSASKGQAAAGELEVRDREEADAVEARDRQLWGAAGERHWHEDGGGGSRGNWAGPWKWSGLSRQARPKSTLMSSSCFAWLSFPVKKNIEFYLRGKSNKLCLRSPAKPTNRRLTWTRNFKVSQRLVILPLELLASRFMVLTFFSYRMPRCSIYPPENGGSPDGPDSPTNLQIQILRHVVA